MQPLAASLLRRSFRRRQRVLLLARIGDGDCSSPPDLDYSALSRAHVRQSCTALFFISIRLFCFLLCFVSSLLSPATSHFKSLNADTARHPLQVRLPHVPRPQGQVRRDQAVVQRVHSAAPCMRVRGRRCPGSPSPRSPRWCRVHQEAAVHQLAPAADRCSTDSGSLGVCYNGRDSQHLCLYICMSICISVYIYATDDTTMYTTTIASII